MQTKTELAIHRGWYDKAGLLGTLRDLVTYEPGDDRATGYIQPLGWLGPLVDRLESDLGIRFPIVAFQAYRNGAGTEWHSDDPFADQAVLSLGVTRTFAIRPMDRLASGGGEYPVHHGDLAVMPAGFQDEWEHRVVPDNSTGERISLVFRTPKR